MPTAHELMQHRITNRERDLDVGDALRRVFAVDAKVEALTALVKASLDPDTLAEAVASRLSVSADAEVVKAAVKEALLEGVAEVEAIE